MCCCLYCFTMISTSHMARLESLCLFLEHTPTFKLSSRFDACCSTYNFCIVHQELSKALDLGGLGFPCTPAMASGIADHVWSVKELLTYKVIPPPLPISKKKKASSHKTSSKYILA